jgi:hypothetical protein
MRRTLTTLQQQLALKVWELSDHRAALLRQVAEIDAYQRDAIRLAEQHGVRQAMIAMLAGVTPQRISQIVAETPLPEESIETLGRAWHKDLEWSQDHLARVAMITTQAERDVWNQRYELVHGRPGNLGSKAPDSYA